MDKVLTDSDSIEVFIEQGITEAVDTYMIKTGIDPLISEVFRAVEEASDNVVRKLAEIAYPDDDDTGAIVKFEDGNWPSYLKLLGKQ